MIIGIVSKSSTAETLLNNLLEADFDLKDVSVIMKDVKTRDAIAQDAGLLKGLVIADLDKRLAQVGLSKRDIKNYSGAVTQGKVLIVVECPKG